MQLLVNIFPMTIYLTLASITVFLVSGKSKSDIRYLTLKPGQTIATLLGGAQHVASVWPPCCDMLGVVGSSLKMVKFEPTTTNTSQHVASGWPNAHNMLRTTKLRYVALTCCYHLTGDLGPVHTRRNNEINITTSKRRYVVLFAV